MKICIECGRQLFDYDDLCDKCNSENIISEKEYNKIIEEIKRANFLTKKKLLQNRDYKCIYDRLQQPEVSYSKPILLGNNNNESDEEYWERIHQHTINKNISTKPTMKCPYCHSKETTKISTTAKMVNTAVWGIFGTKRFKEWHCNECKSNF